MSGWIIITFDPIDNTEWTMRFTEDDSEYPTMDTELSDDYEEIKKALARKLIRTSAVSIVGTDEHEVYAKYNYGEDGPKEVLKQTSVMWERAVILTANDTGDTGTAKLYETAGEGLTVTDEYKERQCNCCGGRVGRVAAAYMMLEHHIDVLADFYDRPYHKMKTAEEIDEKL